MKKYITAGILIGIIIGLALWGRAAAHKKNAALLAMSSRELALHQTTDMATQYHIHPELKIFINGDQVVIPQDMGVTATGMTSIHTHEEPGVIHVEAPIAKDFELGDFFAVWEKDFSSAKLLDATVDSTHEIVMTVNGVKVDTYERTILRDKDQIVISYQTK
jgi:hypothetical protein